MAKQAQTDADNNTVSEDDAAEKRIALVQTLVDMDAKARANGFTIAELLVATAQHQYGVNIRLPAATGEEDAA